MKRVFYIAIFTFVLLSLTSACVLGQSFDIRSLERIKREFSRSSTSPTSTSPSSKTGDTPGVSAIKNKIGDGKSPIKFQSPTEVISQANVSHIDPDTYVLGAGDAFTVNFYGMYEDAGTVKVQPDGTVFIRPAAPIYVQGLTLKQARRKILRVMSRYYHDLKVELQMVELRTFRIEILGEVKAPGTYVINPLVGACDAIGLAGGLNDNASLRNIRLTDKKKHKKWRIDLFAWYYLGDKRQNKLLGKNQMLFVPLMKEKIRAEGAFKRVGFIEIAHGETVKEILRIIEPETGAALSQGKITRVVDDDNLRVIPVNYKKVMRDLESDENIALKDGDVVFVPDLSVFLKKITVVGEFKQSGIFSKSVNRLTGQEEIIKIGLYNLKEGERVKDVLVNMGGVTAKADMDKARVERPIGDGNLKIIPVNIRKLMYEGDTSQNVALKAGDSFIIPAQATNIYILGEVRSPGAYQYNVGNKIKEYIALAGGPTRRARMKHTKIVQHVGARLVTHTVDLRSVLTGNVRESVELRPGDIIYVPYAEVVSYRDIVGFITDLIVLRQLFK